MSLWSLYMQYLHSITLLIMGQSRYFWVIQPYYCGLYLVIRVSTWCDSWEMWLLQMPFFISVSSISKYFFLTFLIFQNSVTQFFSSCRATLFLFYAFSLSVSVVYIPFSVSWCCLFSLPSWTIEWGEKKKLAQEWDENSVW